jgi:uncharacterized protein YacL
MTPPILSDISNFNRVSDYLPILNAAIVVDLVFIFLAFNGVISSDILQKWYKKYQLSAVIADVLILVIGLTIARFFYPLVFPGGFNIWKFTGLAVSVQILHDILFYLFFSSVPVGYNAMLDFFKEYAKSSGSYAILGDSAMIVLVCMLSAFLAGRSLNTNILTLIASFYLLPYLINYR